MPTVKRGRPKGSRNTKPRTPTIRRVSAEEIEAAIERKKELIERLTDVDMARAATKRDRVLSLKFPGHNLDAWRVAALAEGRTLTSWIERALNEAARSGPKPA